MFFKYTTIRFSFIVSVYSSLESYFSWLASPAIFIFRNLNKYFNLTGGREEIYRESKFYESNWQKQVQIIKNVNTE